MQSTYSSCDGPRHSFGLLIEDNGLRRSPLCDYRTDTPCRKTIDQAHFEERAGFHFVIDDVQVLVLGRATHVFAEQMRVG